MRKQHYLVEKVITLYKGGGFISVFAKIRFWDAPLIEIEALVPKKGKIIDLGCGEGILANFLALASPKRRIFGIDVDKKRISEAYRGIPNTKFIFGDITRKSVPKGDCILLVHVLHHLLSFSSQEKLLSACRDRLNRGGKLLIVEVEPNFSWKYLTAWFTDHFLVPWLFERRFYSPIFFRQKKEWQKLIKNLEFSCKIINASWGKPFSHIIFICQKKN